jgi:hypothetical protein
MARTASLADSRLLGAASEAATGAHEIASRRRARADLGAAGSVRAESFRLAFMEGRKGDGDALRAVGPLASWVPAGWYPDPLGVGAARYWDGERWSDRYRDAPPPQPIPASPSDVADAPTAPMTGSPSSGSDPNASPRPNNLWTRTPKGVKIAVGILVLLIIIGAASSGGKNKSATATQASAPAATPTVPAVSLHLNAGSYSTTGSSATLSGTVTPGATVTVNNHAVSVHGSRWSKTIGLQFGENTVEVQASLAGHVSANENITITRNKTAAEREAEAKAHQEKTEHEAKEHQEKTEHEEGEYKEHATSIPYAELQKNAEAFAGKTVTYTGQIFQIQEAEGGGIMLVSVTNEEGFWKDHIYVTYKGHVKGTENSMVTFWGTVKGSKSYKTQAGGETYVPEVEAKYVSG